MLSQIKRFLVAQTFEDEEKERQAGMLNTLLWAAAVLVVLYSLSIPFTIPNPTPVILLLGGVVLLLGITFFLMRQGKVKAASNVLAASLWAITAGTAVFFGGIISPSFASLVLIIFGAGFCWAPGPPLSILF